METLSRSTLLRLPASVNRSIVDWSRLETGIVHLGVGAFHRAHQAVYTDDVIHSGDFRWGTVGASLRASDTRDALKPQDWLYTVAEADQSGERLRVVDSLQGLHVAQEDPAALLDAMCQPSVKIISLTVTEKGYCHDPATGGLNEDHPDIQHDVANPSAPRSAPGFVAQAIKLRQARNQAPFTVLCCDNLPSNGHTVRNVVSRLGALQDRDLGKFIQDVVAFPSTMVDRIVPATTDQDRDRIGRSLGLRDNWPVMTEAFTQWVVEDHFPAGRPDWAATFVSDVSPFETMKLRLLNGSHSCIAYLGYLCGHETVAAAMQDADLASFVRRFMDDEVTPTLIVPAGADVEGYKAALIKRFHNPALRHRTWQIAMDGSQKLPQRLLGTLRDRLKTGASMDCLVLGIAAWMRYVTGLDEKRNPIDVRDPMRDELRKRADAAGLEASQLAPALLSVEKIFDKDLAQHERFGKAVTAALDKLINYGARHTLAAMKGHST
jgi:fructuronate reductase